jgi:predicted dehydrogenase
MVIRFGVAGTGHWAETVHLAGLASRADVDLVGVWGRNRARADALATARGIKSFANFEDMLAQVDAVSIALPPQVQGDLALAAADAGKHLLLEKPLAVSPARAHEIAAAAQRRNLAALVFFMRRFVPEVESTIQAARLERWRDANVRIHSAALIGDGPYAQSIWRQAYAGALWDIGPHVLSVLIPMLGVVENIAASYSDDRVVSMTTLHAGGARAEISLCLHEDADRIGSAYTFRSKHRTLTLPEPALTRPDRLAQAAGDLTAMIESGTRTHRCDLRLGVAAVDILDAASRSIETGRAIDIPRQALPAFT